MHDQSSPTIESWLQTAETQVSRRLPLLLGGAAALLAVGYLAVYIWIALNRIGYPFELEWLEGYMVDTVIRVINGQPIYAEPTLEYVPAVYNPGFYYASALMAQVTGVGFVPLRLVSFISSVATFALMALFVRRETGSWWAGLIAVGLLAATFRVTGAWFDIGRIDSLFHLLLVGALVLVRFVPTTGGAVAAGVLMALAYLTKQSALVTFAPMVLYWLLFDWRRGLVFAGVGAGLILGSVVIFNAMTDGWYGYYTYDVLSSFSDRLRLNYLVEFWTVDLAHVQIALIGALAALFAQLASRQRRAFVFYGLLLSSTLVGGMLSRLNPGGYDNVLITSYLVIALMFGVIVARVDALKREGQADGQAELARFLLYTALIVQLVLLRYPVSEQIPTEADRAAGEQFIAELAALEGEVLLLDHGYYLQMAGHEPHSLSMPLIEVWRYDNPDDPTSGMLLSEFVRAINNREFDAVVLNNQSIFPGDIVAFVTDNYTTARLFFDDPDVFIPVTGKPTRPEGYVVPSGD